MPHDDSQPHAQPHAVTPKLTKNQELVLKALEGSASPKSAYALLDDLRGDGLKAPLQIYRALEKLMELGLVHRLESLNAFVACQLPECKNPQMTAFTICDSCGYVAEVSDGDLSGQLSALAKDTAFELKTSSIELHGTCDACRPA